MRIQRNTDPAPAPRRPRTGAAARIPPAARTAAPAVLVLLLSACAGALPVENPFQAGAERDEVKIHVTNLNFSDATLYLVTPGSRQRLGIVTGKRSATYTVPWRFSTELRLEIDLLAGAKCTTRPLVVDPGEELELIIDADFRRTALCR